MQDIKREITEQEYRTLINKNYNEQHEALFPDGVPMTWSAGYGYCQLPQSYGDKSHPMNGACGKP